MSGTVGMYDHLNQQIPPHFSFSVVDLAKSVIAHNQELALIMALMTRLQFPNTGVARQMPSELELQFGAEFTPQLVGQPVFIPLGETGFLCLPASEIAHALVEIHYGVHRFISALIQNGSGYAARLTTLLETVYSY